MINRKPEILAPCGNPVAFHAALSAGADAVYLALDRFGARAYAGNFRQNELLHALEEAHLHDMKVYLTLNTLLKNEEMKELPAALDPLYREGLDAVLVQDMGVAKLLRKEYPELPLHASTQMNLCSPEGASYVKRMGFTRVVPARELTLAELKRIREQAEIEVEAFVHGAMCVCYSGRCYLSSFAGGRSGNRGRCAQPCRQKYNGAYLLSMKDLCTLEDVPALMEAGIDSLKIEGRMKNEYYVAACVDAYRQMTEDCIQGVFTPERAAAYRQRLAEVFNRGGFTRGYLYQTGGPDMLDEDTPGRAGTTVGKVLGAGRGVVEIRADRRIHAGDSLEIPMGDDEPVKLTVPEEIRDGSKGTLNAPRSRQIRSGEAVIRVRNAAISHELEEHYLNVTPRIPVRLSLKVRTGAPFRITAVTGRATYSVEGPVVEAAKGAVAEDSMIRDKIGTLSGTGFIPEALTIDNDHTGFLSASLIKNARRQVLEGLRQEILRPYRRGIHAHRSYDENEMISHETTHPDSMTEFYGTSRQQSAAMHQSKPDGIYFVSTVRQAELLLQKENAMVILDLGLSREELPKPDVLVDLKRKAGTGCSLLIGFPYIYRTLIPEEEMESLAALAEELDGAYFSGIDSLAWMINRKRRVGKLVLGASLYGYNDLAVAHFCEAVRPYADEILLEAPCELSRKEILGIRLPEGVRRFTTVYGRLPLMLTMQRTSDHPVTLKDRGGEHLVLYSNHKMCYNVLLSGRPVLQDAAEGLTACRFTTEDKETIGRILKGEYNNGIRHQGLI